LEAYTATNDAHQKAAYELVKDYEQDGKKW